MQDSLLELVEAFPVYPCDQFQTELSIKLPLLCYQPLYTKLSSELLSNNTTLIYR